MRLRLVTAACPLCARPPGALVRRARSWLDGIPGRFEVRSCPACGMWITSPRPVAQDLWRVYPAGYHRVRVEDRQPPPEMGRRGALLDVGCGVGDGMVLARSEGWECVGIEVSEEAAVIARARGFEVVVGDALTVEWPARQFDEIRCWHVLEHVPEPARLLVRLRDALASGGRVDLVVPNRASATSMMFRNRWYHLDVPRHLHHFRPRDVSALARSAGLEVVAARHTANAGGILGSLDILAVGSLRRDPRLRSRNRLRSAARAVTWPLARAHLGDVVQYRLGAADA